jgi:hypothetical protein
MNSRKHLFYSLLALLLAGGCKIVGERKIVHIDRRWPAAQVRHVEVHEIDGTIDIQAADTNEITLSAVVHSRIPAKPNQENQGFFRSELDGDTLTIGRKGERRWGIHFGWDDDYRVDYELRVPQAVALDLQTINGVITARGVDGEIRATTVNGIVNIETPGTNEVEARAVNGRISAHFVKDFHGASFKTVNGRVVAVLPPSASFIGDFTQVNGDVEAAFPLNIHSHPGSRRVSGEVNGGRYSLHITTVNGDIKVENGGPAAPPPPPPPPPAPST